MNKREEAIRTMEVFNEKADRLLSSSFAREIAALGLRTRISWKKGEPIVMECKGPDQESVEAFVLTLRFFIQDNEKTSFRKLAETYNSLPLPKDLQEAFEQCRAQLNDCLDQHDPAMQIKVGDKILTRGEILRVFVYGDLAHSTQRSTYESWKTNPVKFGFLQQEFKKVLWYVLQAIARARELNKRAIRELGAVQPE